MNLIGISINHKTAPIEFREALYLNESEIAELVPVMKKVLICEGFILSTCNRTEIFGFPASHDINAKSIQQFLLKHKPVDGISEDNFSYYFSCSAVKHIFNVAAGLDSLMLGDSQILSQIKNAFQISEEVGFSSSVMKRIFDASTRVGKRAINETGIGEGAVTISYAAVQLIEKIFASFDNKKALVIGAGETSELAVTHLKDKMVSDITITNRTFEKAETLAKKHNLKVLDFNSFKTELHNFDIIISATSAKETIVKFEDISVAIKKRSGNPVCITDIAIPRDIDAEVGNLDNVFYNDIDSLNIIVEQNLEKRKKEIPKVSEVVNEELIQLFNWYNTLGVVPTIKRLRNYFEHMRQDELHKIKHKINDDDFEKVDDMTRRLLGRLLHYPTMKLRELSETGTQFQEATNYSLILKDLYKLSENKAEEELEK